VKETRSTAVGAAVPLMLPRRPSMVADYLALTKPRLNLLVVATSAAAYYLGVPDSARSLAGIDWLRMVHAVGGTALVAGGAAVLNQVYERDTDALMRRTRERPLPDGRVTASDARVFGIILALAGVAWLAAASNLLAALLACATLGVYLIVYTPMKRRSAAATLIGAVPGALPPVIGWTAAQGTASAGGWVLFAIVFFWQIPHFMAIAWLYRDDYRQAGFPMLPVVEPDGKRTGRQALFYSALLVAASIVPTLLAISGWMYFWIAAGLGAGMLFLSARFAAERSAATARLLFLGSITYLPLIWLSMVLDH
jgi:protoheme IX farnesyltransferase